MAVSETSMGDSSGRGAGPPTSLADDALKLQLEAADQRLRVVLGITDSILFDFNGEGRCLAVWTRSDDLLAAPQSTVVGRTMAEIVGPEVANPLVERIQRVLATGQLERFEYAMEVAGGRRWFCAEAVGVTLGRSVTFLVRDITLQKTLELRLLQADRLAALGTLAAGVAHEVSNPLGYVSSNLNFISSGLAAMRRALSSGEPADLALLALTLDECAEALEEAREGTSRLLHLTGDLKTYARGADALDGQADLRRVLETSINIALSAIQPRARLVKSMGEAPPVRGNESRLGQVFLNLLLNAAQAIPEGAPEKNAVEVLLRAHEGRVVVEIRDTGVGIAPEHLKRIFDPFFSTKPVGVGTGLGLSISHSIVTGLGGDISVESTVGQGTCFRVVLPLASGTAPRTPTPAPA